jgi:hypothetical protein
LSVIPETGELNPHANFQPASFNGQAAADRRVLSSEHFRINFPSGTEESDAGAALRILESARQDLIHRAGAETPDAGVINVTVHASTPEFVAASNQPGWVGGASIGRMIELQPLSLLRKRGVFATTLRHEYAHIMVLNLGKGRVPRWLAEGLAAHFAGEGKSLTAVPSSRISQDELEKRLAHPASAAEMESLYAAAYREVRSLISAKGEKAVWRELLEWD